MKSFLLSLRSSSGSFPFLTFLPFFPSSSFSSSSLPSLRPISTSPKAHLLHFHALLRERRRGAAAELFFSVPRLQASLTHSVVSSWHPEDLFFSDRRRCSRTYSRYNSSSKCVGRHCSNSTSTSWSISRSSSRYTSTNSSGSSSGSNSGSSSSSSRSTNDLSSPLRSARSFVDSHWQRSLPCSIGSSRRIHSARLVTRRHSSLSWLFQRIYPFFTRTNSNRWSCGHTRGKYFVEETRASAGDPHMKHLLRGLIFLAVPCPLSAATTTTPVHSFSETVAWNVHPSCFIRVGISCNSSSSQPHTGFSTRVSSPWQKISKTRRKCFAVPLAGPFFDHLSCIASYHKFASNTLAAPLLSASRVELFDVSFLRRHFSLVAVLGVSFRHPQQQLCLRVSRSISTPRVSPALLSAAAAAAVNGEEHCHCSGAYGRYTHPHHEALHSSFQCIDTNNDGYISKKEFFAWACCHLLPRLPQQLLESDDSPFLQRYSPRCIPKPAGLLPEQLEQQQEIHHMPHHHQRLLLLLQRQQRLQEQQPTQDNQGHPSSRDSQQQQLPEEHENRHHLPQTVEIQREEAEENKEASTAEPGETVAQCLIKAEAFARSWRRKKEKTVDATTILLVATWASIPYVGFGFMDNCLMLLCGEIIDTHIGAALGVSTLAAAGLGNLLSCASGVVTGGCVERLAAKITLLPRVQLSSAQSNAKIISRARTAGALVGICCGCVLGLFPLLFFGIKRKEMRDSEDSFEDEDIPEQ